MLVALATLASCRSGQISTEIQRQFEARGSVVDLATAYPSQWERVCILGPYSRNSSARTALGFEWDAEANSSIESNDRVSLLIFVSNGEVVEYVEHPRSHGDFSNLTTQCFAKTLSVFAQDQRPEKGWPGLFPVVRSN